MFIRVLFPFFSSSPATVLVVVVTAVIFYHPKSQLTFPVGGALSAAAVVLYSPQTVSPSWWQPFTRVWSILFWHCSENFPSYIAKKWFQPSPNRAYTFYSHWLKQNRESLSNHTTPVNNLNLVGFWQHQSQASRCKSLPQNV